MVTGLFRANFWFLRHGQTAANAADIIAGALDVPLDATGLAQAHAAADLLMPLPIAAIWCSPQMRARQTAAPLAARLGLVPHLVPELAERNWGAWEGAPRNQLRREATPEGGESPDDFALRCAMGLARITPPFPVLIVAHSGTARAIAALLLPGHDLRRIGNAEAVQWQRDGAGGWMPRSLNGAPLTGAGVSSE